MSTCKLQALTVSLSSLEVDSGLTSLNAPTSAQTSVNSTDCDEAGSLTCLRKASAVTWATAASEEVAAKRLSELALSPFTTAFCRSAEELDEEMPTADADDRSSRGNHGAPSHLHPIRSENGAAPCTLPRHDHWHLSPLTTSHTLTFAVPTLTLSEEGAAPMPHAGVGVHAAATQVRCVSQRPSLTDSFPLPLTASDVNQSGSLICAGGAASRENFNAPSAAVTCSVLSVSAGLCTPHSLESSAATFIDYGDAATDSCDALDGATPGEESLEQPPLPSQDSSPLGSPDRYGGLGEPADASSSYSTPRSVTQPSTRSSSRSRWKSVSPLRPLPHFTDEYVIAVSEAAKYRWSMREVLSSHADEDDCDSDDEEEEESA